MGKWIANFGAIFLKRTTFVVVFVAFGNANSCWLVLMCAHTQISNNLSRQQTWSPVRSQLVCWRVTTSRCKSQEALLCRFHARCVIPWVLDNCHRLLWFSPKKHTEPEVVRFIFLNFEHVCCVNHDPNDPGHFPFKREHRPTRRKYSMQLFNNQTEAEIIKVVEGRN